jgi:hypothetical protein
MTYSYVLEFTKCAIQSVTIIFSFFYPAGKAGGTQIGRCQGIAVKSYGGTLGALALDPSGFCIVRVNLMKILYILRSQPDETVEKLATNMFMENATTVVMLYEDLVDWAALIDKIFEYDKVICWW